MAAISSESADPVELSSTEMKYLGIAVNSCLGVAGSDSDAAHGLRLVTLAEAGDDGPSLGDGGLDPWQLERRLVQLLALPHLGYPQRVGVGRIECYDVA